MGAETPPTPSLEPTTITLSSKQVIYAKMKITKADGTVREIILKEPDK